MKEPERSETQQTGTAAPLPGVSFLDSKTAPLPLPFRLPATAVHNSTMITIYILNPAGARSLRFLQGAGGIQPARVHTPQPRNPADVRTDETSSSDFPRFPPSKPSS